MAEYEFHPFADAFPMMTDREHAELVADIKANGLREPIWLYEDENPKAPGCDYGKDILDGRNRYKACRELGIKPIYSDFEGTDQQALAFVISMNLVRRHLDESLKRAMIAAKLSGLKPGQHADQALPIGRAAKMLNVGERSVARARKVIDKGDPELVAAVERGDLAVSRAAREIDDTDADQDDDKGAAANNGHDTARAGDQNDRLTKERERLERAEQLGAAHPTRDSAGNEHEQSQDDDGLVKNQNVERMQALFKSGRDKFLSFFAVFAAVRETVGDEMLPKFCVEELGIGLSVINVLAGTLLKVDEARVRAELAAANRFEKAKRAAQVAAARTTRDEEKAARDLATKAKSMGTARAGAKPKPKPKPKRARTSAPPPVR